MPSIQWLDKEGKTVLKDECFFPSRPSTLGTISARLPVTKRV